MDTNVFAQADFGLGSAVQAIVAEDTYFPLDRYSWDGSQASHSPDLTFTPSTASPDPTGDADPFSTSRFLGHVEPSKHRQPVLPPQVFRDEVFSEGFFLGSEDLHGKDLFGDDDSDTDDFAFDPAFGNSPIPSHLHASIHIDKAPFPPFDLNDDLNELDEDDYEPELHLPAPVAVHPLDVLGSLPVGGDDFDEDYSDTDQPFVPPAPLAPTATLTLTFNSAVDDPYDPDTTYTGELHSSPAQSTSKILSYNDAAYDDEEFRPTVTSSSRKRSKSSKSDSSAKRKASGGDPSALPYGCNYPSCMDKGKGKDSEDYEELSTDENSFRTIRDLRDHIDEHKRLGDRAGDVPFRCALESCGKTFKSLSGLRFHFQNASTNGHYFAATDDDERPVKKTKSVVDGGRTEACPIPGCGKAFKQSAGTAYHIAHHHSSYVNEQVMASFSSTLQSKLKWWFSKMGRKWED